MSAQKIIVEKKNVYGKELVYPVCITAKRFAYIAAQKTLSNVVIQQIKELGYEIECKQQTL